MKETVFVKNPIYQVFAIRFLPEMDQYSVWEPPLSLTEKANEVLMCEGLDVMLGQPEILQAGRAGQHQTYWSISGKKRIGQIGKSSFSQKLFFS